MNNQFIMQVIVNDLDSMALRIESLAAHTELTSAGEFVRRAKDAVNKARSDIHQQEMQVRFGPRDENECPGHIASDADPKICSRCGVHIDSFKSD